jgi:hypothetical protein
MRGAILPLSHYVFMACCLVKHRDTFTFYLSRFRVKLNPCFESQKALCSLKVGVLWIKIYYQFRHGNGNICGKK